MIKQQPKITYLVEFSFNDFPILLYTAHLVAD